MRRDGGIDQPPDNHFEGSSSSDHLGNYPDAGERVLEFRQEADVPLVVEPIRLSYHAALISIGVNWTATRRLFADSLAVWCAVAR